MISRERYTDINRVCEMIRVQVIDSIPYAYENCPQFDSPKQLFKWLKNHTSYKSDPEGVELIQSMPTLFSNFKHRSGKVYKSGQGDCDCFTVTALACMYVQGKDWIEDFGFVLAGRSQRQPVHIYPYIVYDGKYHIFDLTQPGLDRVNKYPIQQNLKL